MTSSKTTIRERRDTRHGLHLILTVMTCGMWSLIGWPVAWAWNKFGPRKRTTIRTRERG